MATNGDELWPVTWDAHRRRQLREIARVPLEERIRWLEEELDAARETGILARACERRDRWIAKMWPEAYD